MRPLLRGLPALLLIGSAACNNTAQPVRLANVPPEIAITQPTVPTGADTAGPFEPAAGIVLEARCSDPEDAAAELVVHWTATQTDAGQTEPLDLGTSAPDSTGFVSRVVNELSAGRWILTANVQDLDGATAQANVPVQILAVNLQPAVQIAAPAGGSEHIEAQTVSFSGLVSDDRGPDGLSVEWFSTLDGVLDSSPPAGSGALAFSTPDLSIGQHTVTVTVTDAGGLTATDLVTFTVVPANSPPTAPTVDVQPDPASTVDALQCVVLVASTDPDGLAVTLAYRWLRDGQPTAFLDAVLDAQETTRGDLWTCEVTGSDGVLLSTVGSDSITIGNTPPELTTATVTPTPAFEDTTLVCSGDGWFDEDGDSPGYEIAWEVNGAVVLGAMGPTLDGLDFDRGDQVACVVTPFDGLDSGIPVASAPVLIENTPPLAPIVSVSPAPSAPDGAALSCSAGGSIDEDGDPITYTTRWWMGGALQPAYDGLFSVPANATQLGQVWTCEARASDGLVDSSWVGASTTVMPALGDVVISEFLADAANVSDAAGEWVELYNASGAPINLQGFVLRDDGTDAHTITAALTVPAGGRVVLARNDDVSSNGGVIAAYEYTGFVLGNSADQIVLSFLGLEVDRFNYTLATWPAIAGHSVSLSPALGPPNAALNDLSANWCGSMFPITAPGSDFGTPGTSNDSCLCWPSDGDLDGYGTAAFCSIIDCNDGNAGINPAATETCENGVDEDCTGADALCSCLSTDNDNDGFGTGLACTQLDCNDANSNVYPGAAETCNGANDDCDGFTDEGFNNDGDSYTTCGGDCNDGNPSVYPNAPELCNGVSDDCDALIDEGWDGDGDGWTSCNGDCNNGNSTIYPGANDFCDGVNQDCDGSIDENAAADGFEPNSTSGSAFYLGGNNLIVDLWGTFHWSTDNDDWYWINTSDDTDIGCDLFNISVVLDSIPSGTDYDVYLYTANLTLIGSSINVNNASESIGWSPGCLSWGNDGGVYYVRVSRWSGWSCSDTYHLRTTNTN